MPNNECGPTEVRMSNDEVRIKLEAYATGTKSEPWTLNYHFAKLVGKWLGDRDSNPDYMVQSHAWCHYTIPQSCGMRRSLYQKDSLW